MINKYDDFLNNLIKEDVENDEFSISVKDIEQKLNTSIKKVRTVYNNNKTNDGQIIEIDKEYYTMFIFTPIDTGSTSLTDKEKIDINEITNSVFKMKIKITGVNIVNNKNEYTYTITSYENMNKYNTILNKFKNNVKVFNSSLLDNKIHSYFIFSKLDNIKETSQRVFKKLTQPTKIIE